MAWRTHWRTSDEPSSTPWSITQNVPECGLGQAKKFQYALQDFTEDFVKHGACFSEGEDPAAGEKEITALIKSLDTTSLPTDSGRPLTQSLACNGIAATLSDR
ncbi:hypothetical protein AB0P41_27570 [Streptomyces sp. NPDC079167]|uniref:hypothetical protein n=1 Tax=Streptomyces sp. NPDC079167 TaxID=3154513 RepID=UPI003413DB22